MGEKADLARTIVVDWEGLPMIEEVLNSWVTRKSVHKTSVILNIATGNIDQKPLYENGFKKTELGYIENIEGVLTRSS